MPRLSGFACHMEPGAYLAPGRWRQPRPGSLVWAARFGQASGGRRSCRGAGLERAGSPTGRAWACRVCVVAASELQRPSMATPLRGARNRGRTSVVGGKLSRV
jgi:hypothetical protein